MRLLVAPAEGTLESMVQTEIRRATSLRPIRDVREDDVFVVAYPKSGMTWAQHLLAGALYGLDPRYMPDTLVQELVPDVHAKRYFRRFGSPMCFKSHSLPRPEYRRVIYLLRDGRDVMVSYFHHLVSLGNREDDTART